MDDVRIDEEDIAVFRKVLAYYYLCDAFTWCRRNGLECDGNLARNMASAMQCDDARGPWVPGTGHVSNRRTKSAATCSSSAPHPFHSSTLGL